MYAFITEDNHESKKAKGINKSVVDNELKYEDYKMVLFNKSDMRNEMNKIQSKFLCLLTTKKNIYLKMDIVDYHIFINLLVNHIKNIFCQL